MDKPVTAQELITLIENYQKEKYWPDPGFENAADYQLDDADKLITACRMFLEEMENGT